MGWSAKPAWRRCWSKASTSPCFGSFEVLVYPIYAFWVECVGICLLTWKKCWANAGVTHWSLGSSWHLFSKLWRRNLSRVNPGNHALLTSPKRIGNSFELTASTVNTTFLEICGMMMLGCF
jgi:hypothetical protein